jgi:hypothetical protein
MASFDLSLPESLSTALRAEALRTGRASASIIADALSQYLGLRLHTLFQVSTSGALVAGIFEREVSVRTVLEHGDFGLGTFADLDGEMVVLDGHAYQALLAGRRRAIRHLSRISRISRSAAIDTAILTTSSMPSGWMADLRECARGPSILPRPMRTWWTRPSRRANSSLSTLTGRWSGFGHQDSQAPSRYPAIISTSSRTTADMAGTCSMSQPVP